MDVSTCRNCGAELVPQTSFCRQCGAAIAPGDALPGDERPTALFDEADVAATQRLDPRETAPPRSGLNVSPPPVSAAAVKPANKSVLIGIILLLLLAGIVSTVALVRNRIRSHSASAEGLTYPSARKTLDVVAESEGRAITMETSDSFEKVDAWYRATLKPQKVVQLMPGTVVMKNGKTTATILGQSNKTLILLKIDP